MAAELAAQVWEARLVVRLEPLGQMEVEVSEAEYSKEQVAQEAVPRPKQLVAAVDLEGKEVSEART